MEQSAKKLNISEVLWICRIAQKAITSVVGEHYKKLERNGRPLNNEYN